MFKTLPRRALLWAALPALLFAPNAVAAGDDRREQIPIESWSFGPAHSSAGASAGKVSYSDLSVMISLEKASPLDELALAGGERFEAVELTFRAPAGVLPGDAGDGKRLDYLTITLEEVMVSSYQLSGHTARLSLNFTRIANQGTGKTMAAEVLASTVGGANFALADGSVRFLR
jgi:prepilin-type processing-associated H-X9-DG protein